MRAYTEPIIMIILDVSCPLREESKLITLPFFLGAQADHVPLFPHAISRELCSYANSALIDHDPEVQTTWTIVVVIEWDVAHSRILKYSAEISINNHNISPANPSTFVSSFVDDAKDN
jgi:hypothetical protein